MQREYRILSHPVYRASQVRRSLLASQIALDFQFQALYFIAFFLPSLWKNIFSAFQPTCAQCACFLKVRFVRGRLQTTPLIENISQLFLN